MAVLRPIARGRERGAAAEGFPSTLETEPANRMERRFSFNMSPKK